MRGIQIHLTKILASFVKVQIEAETNMKRNENRLKSSLWGKASFFHKQWTEHRAFVALFIVDHFRMNDACLAHGEGVFPFFNFFGRFAHDARGDIMWVYGCKEQHLIFMLLMPGTHSYFKFREYGEQRGQITSIGQGCIRQYTLQVNPL